MSSSHLREGVCTIDGVPRGNRRAFHLLPGDLVRMIDRDSGEFLKYRTLKHVVVISWYIM